MKEKRISLLVYIISLIVMLLIIVGLIFYIIQSKGDENINTKKTNDIATKETNVIVGSVLENNTLESNNIDTNIKIEESFEDLLIEYILDSIETYAKDNYILKSTVGDVTADKLTTEEVKNSRLDYENKIRGMLSDKEIFGELIVIDNKKACTYNLEKILNNLELGTHMGIGIGCYDDNNNKLYISGNKEIDKERPTRSNIIRYFGFNEEELINNILDSIEIYAKNNYILKSTVGDVTAKKLTETEAKANREDYREKINELLKNEVDMFSLYFEDNSLNCKYNFEKLINQLGLGSHMGIGIDVDEDGMKVYKFVR